MIKDVHAIVDGSPNHTPLEEKVEQLCQYLTNYIEEETVNLLEEELKGLVPHYNKNENGKFINVENFKVKKMFLCLSGVIKNAMVWMLCFLMMDLNLQLPKSTMSNVKIMITLNVIQI